MSDHPLRELARQIALMAQPHTDAYEAVRNCREHLETIARIRELEAELVAVREQVAEATA